MIGFDATTYGQLLIALRYRRGFKNGKEFARMVADGGVQMSKDALWAIERGQRVPGVDRHLAFCHLLKPPCGYFEEAYRGQTLDRE